MALSRPGWREITEEDGDSRKSESMRADAIELEDAGEARHGAGRSEGDEHERHNLGDGGGDGDADGTAGDVAPGRRVEYKVYKRRWFGLLQLTLLNVIVSWDVSISLFPFAPRRRFVCLRPI